jgi:prophage regulatory protein
LKNASQESLPQPHPQQILRLFSVMQRTGIPRSTLYALIKAGTFPRARVRITERTRGWVKSDVDAWIAARIKESESPSEAA